ncbi:MAG: type III secretion system export apparatus subunit SctU [Chlamydiae bacterium]|nr:type III secretion system export apparatus subunit SctU [Chlamydiota bacterium]
MAEKTEKATPKKLKDARKKGQVAKSQDFPSALTFLVAIFGTLFLSSFLYQTLGNYIASTFKAVSSDLDLQSKAGAYLSEAFQVILTCSLPLMIIVTFVGVITNFLIIGPVFSMEALKFDIKKLNPIEGIKQKFKLKVLVELIKSVLKITGAATLIYFVIMNMLPEIIVSVKLPVIGSALIIDDFLRKVSIQVGLFFFAVAIFDLAFQKRTFAKEMMMEKFELKQEYKDTEGDPHIKGRRREMFREVAYSEGPAGARRAKAIITNPTHIAVAIGYEEGKDPVPTIITMGQGSMAKKIIDVGIEFHIPIMRNVDLARGLFYKGNIGDFIPKETYKPIAEVLKWLKTMAETPDVNVGIFQK